MRGILLLLSLLATTGCDQVFSLDRPPVPDGPDGSRTTCLVPMPAASGTWKSVAAGGDETCAIKDDDTLWCWGANADGQIGDGTAWSPTWVTVAL
ncbi:MAG: protein alpha-tubulin suppressor [Myxococcales bacterium]|nr:protein alpha-tubulin suppressor [Myxococcales bacterium]